jgi:magnesium transporter
VHPSKQQLHTLAGELGLHELAVEDALGPHQRPKLDRYATHLFLSCHAVWVDVESARLEETEVDAFISKRWLITRPGERPVLDRARAGALGPLA